jgi:hypothetical protein
MEIVVGVDSVELISMNGDLTAWIAEINEEV